MEEKTSQTITLSISSNVLSGGNISQVSSRINKNFELSLLISQLKQKVTIYFQKQQSVKYNF